MRRNKFKEGGKRSLGRREFLKAGLLSSGLATTAMALKSSLIPTDPSAIGPNSPEKNENHGHSGSMGTVGTVDHEANGFDPHEMLTDWDFGEVSTLPNGQTLREYQIVSVDKEIEIAPGVFFPGWVYNGRVPGPTLRCVEGDRIRIEFSLGFHGRRPRCWRGDDRTG
jgi:FtsP/CotA-like multicopper oxidase with cupredoxin domain